MAETQQPLRIVASPEIAAPERPPGGEAGLHSAAKRLAAQPTALVEAAAPSDDRDPYAVTAFANVTDRSLHATLARFTGGLSPAALIQAYSDWATHLAAAPGKRLQLVDKAARKAIRFGNYAYRYALEGADTQNCIEPLPQDRRFAADDWRKWPFNFISQAFLLQQQWWHNATMLLQQKSLRDEVERPFPPPRRNADPAAAARCNSACPLRARSDRRSCRTGSPCARALSTSCRRFPGAAARCVAQSE